ncbi:MAG TPA: hypothetical protein VJ302_07470, partial [Blastocatellia bacterium]|nr:hypothetical protein [Blastocatellia bacterium]
MTIQWGRPPLAAVISVVLILGAVISAQVRGADEPEGPIRLEPGQPITRNLAGHETQVYTVNLSAGQFFEACLDRLGMVVDIK